MYKAEDLSGKVFGRLTVVGRTGSRNNYALWGCVCSCGKKLEVTSTRLRNGQQSCGCIRRGMKLRNLKSLKRLEGKVFGRLTVVDYRGADSSGKALWNCVCQCGGSTVVTGYNLRSGLTKSCGCMRGETVRLPLGESAKRRVLHTYKRHARERNLVWALSIEEFCSLTSQPCFYCGAKGTNRSSTRDAYGEFVYNGIDRIDSSGGYTVDNIVACCGICNWMKSNLSKEEFLNHIRRVFHHSRLTDEI